MKMTKHTLSNLAAAALIVFLVAGATMAMAQRGRHEPKMKRGWPRFDGPENRIEMLAKRLDLTPEQQAAVEKIHMENRQDAVGLRKDLNMLVHELKGEMMRDNPSEEKVLDLNRKIGQIKTELEGLHLQGRLAVRRQLTAEQRDKMILMSGLGGPGKGRSPEGPGFFPPRGEDAPKAHR